MSTSTDQRKNVRIIAYNAAQVQELKSVKIVTTSNPALKEHVQMTSAQNTANPGQFPTYMDETAHPAGLPTIYISGYTAPN